MDGRWLGLLGRLGQAWTGFMGLQCFETLDSGNASSCQPIFLPAKSRPLAFKDSGILFASPSEHFATLGLLTWPVDM
ncbi:hypothetical protein BJ166DRAFT_505597 [Pestalotiopsis sp. NC0098]|nr:hypothetical protein BJ166DRAFT_505597 [Pestalotiopsis sp. NC0098]